MKVFIVENHPAVRQGIVETINREATLCVCGEAEDVQPALAAIETSQPDLVLADIQLKSSNGLDLIRALRASPVPARRQAPPLYWAGFVCHGEAR